MMDKKKNHTPKQLATSPAAELAARPGRLPPTQEAEKAFLHRVSKGKARESARVLAAAQLLQEKLWADVAHSAITALERIFGVQTAQSRVQRVKGGKVRPSQHGARADLTRAHDMLHTLLEFMHDRAAEAMAAHLILNDRGELQAQDEHYLPERRREIPGERPTEMWAKPASDDPIVRLRR